MEHFFFFQGRGNPYFTDVFQFSQGIFQQISQVKYFHFPVVHFFTDFDDLLIEVLICKLVGFQVNFTQFQPYFQFFVHLREQYADGKWTEYMGQGVTDFTAIAKALKKQNFKGNAVIELAFPGDYKPVNPLKEDWKLSRKYVKKVFGW